MLYDQPKVHKKYSNMMEASGAINNQTDEEELKTL